MASNAAVCGDAIAPLARRGDGKLVQLSDRELLASTRQLIGATNQILAELLVHLAEVETRGIYRARLCTSLYTYCVYELRLSEDAAFRRVSAARLVQRFPRLHDAIASGELHLTGLLMLGPHLTQENIGEVLPRAKHRTKKEIAQLVRQLDPLPDVPARIQPLGPEFQLPRTLRAPTWQEAMLALNPVNHLRAGQRPREWMSDAPLALVSDMAESEPVADMATGTALARARPVPLGRLAPLTGPQRYQVQFTAGQEYVDLVERAQALLSHTSRGELAELHLRAMRTLVAELERRKYATRPKAAENATAPGDSEDSDFDGGAAGTRAGAGSEAASECATADGAADQSGSEARDVDCAAGVTTCWPRRKILGASACSRRDKGRGTNRWRSRRLRRDLTGAPWANPIDRSDGRRAQYTGQLLLVVVRRQTHSQEREP